MHIENTVLERSRQLIHSSLVYNEKNKNTLGKWGAMHLSEVKKGFDRSIWIDNHNCLKSCEDTRCQLIGCCLFIIWLLSVKSLNITNTKRGNETWILINSIFDETCLLWQFSFRKFFFFFLSKSTHQLLIEKEYSGSTAKM